MTPSKLATATTGAAESAREGTVAVGALVGFAALAMTFAALLLAYGLVRIQAGVWPPANEAHLPMSMWPWPVGATATAGLGSAAMYRATRTWGTKRASALLSMAGLAGIAFVLIQVSGARGLLNRGIRPSAGIATSVVYALTAFHAIHALAATIAIGCLLVAIARGRDVRAGARNAVATFVHLVAGLWLILCAAVFVL